MIDRKKGTVSVRHTHSPGSTGWGQFVAVETSRFRHLPEHAAYFLDLVHVRVVAGNDRQVGELEVQGSYFRKDRIFFICSLSTEQQKRRALMAGSR